MNKTLRLYLRIAATVLLLLGLLMVGSSLLNWYNLSGYDIVRWLHIIIALAVVGLYEMNMARNRTIMTPSGRQIGTVGRILISLTLLLGIFLLLNTATNWIMGDEGLIWVHVVLGLASVALTELVFSRRNLGSRV